MPLFLLEGIAREVTRVDWPPSDGTVERLYRRLLDEDFRVRSRTLRRGPVAEMQVVRSLPVALPPCTAAAGAWLERQDIS